MAVTRKEFRRFSRPVLKSQRWKVLRMKILERDGWKCQCCGSRKRLEVDHVKAVRNAPDRAFDPTNLQVLCGTCHGRKTMTEVGFKPTEIDPKRQAWREAVADMAPEQPTKQKDKTNA